LTPEQAAEIRRERAAGSSEYALARKYKVARNTIHAIVIGKTYPPPLPCPDAECPENEQKQGENGP